ncbi:hypothetical protein PoB_000622400 [Plakobranchus ocellatus]|uniref:Uncharacterized protein n=1 Tax=Plakobranchus ocellatus TaxID=259542 RepID=A0AAV3YCB5_9GAST|nr:hypothetical protein PoB_000622400 [Plakobranchus ocellatus]
MLTLIPLGLKSPNMKDGLDRGINSTSRRQDLRLCKLHIPDTLLAYCYLLFDACDSLYTGQQKQNKNYAQTFCYTCDSLYPVRQTLPRLSSHQE